MKLCFSRENSNKDTQPEKVALLKGVHRVEGFRLYCKVYDVKGMRIVNKLLVEEVGEANAYSRFLGELKWQSESLIVVKPHIAVGRPPY